MVISSVDMQRSYEIWSILHSQTILRLSCFNLPQYIFCSDEFSGNDVIVNNSVVEVGGNTVLSIVVNEPGEDNPVPKNIVQDAMYQSIQEDATTNITSLQLALVNEPEVSIIQRANAINVSLTNTRVNQVS